MTVLAAEYRPCRFADVVGQRHATPVLRAMVRRQEVPPSLLFSGPRGTGKTSVGRIFAAALNCEAVDATGDCCAECVHCRSVQNSSSLSVMEVDAASNGLVGDIRQIREMVGYSHEGAWRVILLDEAQQMSKEAFGALLKTLEEPPPHTTFVLLTTERHRIIPTVASRSMEFRFRRLSVKEIGDRLAFVSDEIGLGASRAMLDEIAVRSEGGMRDALMTLDQASRVGVTDVEGLRELYGLKDCSLELFTAALDGDFARGSRLIEEHFYATGDAESMVRDLIVLVRDLLVLRQGGHLDYREAEVERKALADRVEDDRLVSAIKVLWELRGRVRASELDHRSSMEMAQVLIADALRDRPIPSVNGHGSNGHAPVSAIRRLTLAEMEQVVRDRHGSHLSG